MLNILSRITGKPRAEIIDARVLYRKVMEQSRKPEFYGDDLCADTTDGRMEILCMHLSTIMFILREHGEAGATLTQALYDVMINDFDVALREEGLSDTGVSRRIKPLAKMFFARARQYADAFNSDDIEGALETIIKDNICKIGGNDALYIVYVKDFHANLAAQKLGSIARGKLDFPRFH